MMDDKPKSDVRQIFERNQNQNLARLFKNQLGPLMRSSNRHDGSESQQYENQFSNPASQPYSCSQTPGEEEEYSQPRLAKNVANVQTAESSTLRTF